MSFRANGGLPIDDHSQGAMTMKLIATMMLTVDGVYQGPGGPDEDGRGGFERGGWVAPYGDEEGWTFLTSMFERADALLLGRRTFEIWWLLERDLVDELNVRICPVIVGDGLRQTSRGSSTCSPGSSVARSSSRPSTRTSTSVSTTPTCPSQIW